MQFVRAFKDFSVNHGCVKDLNFKVIIFHLVYFVDNYLFFQFFHLSTKNEEDQLTMNETSFSFIFLLFLFTMIVFFCVHW